MRKCDFGFLRKQLPHHNISIKSAKKQQENSYNSSIKKCQTTLPSYANGAT